jgi:hypothetical protein
MEEADQWSETSYTVMNNLVFMNFVDRKDPQVINDPGITVEEFLVSPSVKEWSKKWMMDMLEKYSVE